MSLPEFWIKRAVPPGWWSRNKDASWMKPDTSNKARDFDSSWTVASSQRAKSAGGSGHTGFPRHYREFVGWDWPNNRILNILQSLELHCQDALFDLVAREYPKMRSKPEHVACSDEPLGRVVLPPAKRVSRDRESREIITGNRRHNITAYR